MTKKLKIYQIGFIISTVVCIGLMLAMGIIAVQKQMKLNMSFQMNPSIVCKIYAGIGSDSNLGSDETLIFSNVDGDLSIHTNWTINANTLSYDNAISDVMGQTIYLKVVNYTDCRVLIEPKISDTVQTSKITVMEASNSGITDETTFSVGVPGSSVTGFQLNFTQAYKISTNLTNLTIAPASNVYTIESEYYVKSGQTPTFTLTSDANYETLLSEDIDITNASAGYVGEVLTISNITGDVTLTATVEKIPYTIGTYVASGGATPGDKVSDTTVYFPAFAQENAVYKYLELEGVEYPQTYKADNVTVSVTSGAEGTTGSIGKGSDGYEYYYQNAMQFQYKSGSTHQFSTTYGVSGWYKIEPIRWIIIGGEADTSIYGAGAATNADDLAAGEVLLLSERVLYGVPFDGSHYTSSSSYQNIYYNGAQATSSDIWCSINGWTGSRGDSDPNTNGGVDYINQAAALHVRKNYFAKFSGLEDFMTNHNGVISTKNLVTTYRNTSTNQGDTNSYEHNIFLLGGTGSDSFLYSNYLGSSGDSRLIGYATGFAHATSAYGSGSGSASRASYWWLRSGRSSNATYAYLVLYDGFVSLNLVNRSNCGVRPCFCLNLA